MLVLDVSATTRDGLGHGFVEMRLLIFAIVVRNDEGGIEITYGRVEV